MEEFLVRKMLVYLANIIGLDPTGRVDTALLIIIIDVPYITLTGASALQYNQA